MTNKIDRFARDWVSRNVMAVAGLGDLPREVDRLACQMTADARVEGISGRELVKSVGDLDYYLTGEYQKVQAAA